MTPEFHHIAIPSERPASPHSSHHRTSVPKNASVSQSDPLSAKYPKNSSSASFSANGTCPSPATHPVQHSQKSNPQISRRHVSSFLRQVEKIENLNQEDASFSAMDGNFQLFHLDELEMDHGDEVENKKRNLEASPQNVKDKKQRGKTRAKNHQRRRIKSSSQNSGNRITFAVKMQFPKASFQNVVYRLIDLEKRHEWDLNVNSGLVVHEFASMVYEKVKDGISERLHHMNDEQKDKDDDQHQNQQDNRRRERHEKSRETSHQRMDSCSGKHSPLPQHHSKDDPHFSNPASRLMNGKHDIIYIHMKSPTKLVKDRDTLLYRYTAQAPDGKSLVSIMQTYDDGENKMGVTNLPKKNPKIVRALTHLHGYYVEDKGDHVQVIMLSDHDVGHVPQFLVKMLFDKKSLEWYRQFAKAVGMAQSKM